MGRFTDFLFGTEPVERNAVSAPVQMIGFPSDGGLLPGGVNATTALGLSAVWRSIDILSNGVSQLPWREMRGNLELPASRIVDRPQSWRTRREWTSLVVATLALYDVCYLLKIGGIDSEGVPVGLWPVPPGLVQPIDEDPYGLYPATEYFIGGKRVSADDLVILRRSPLPGISDSLGGVIRIARTEFAGYLAASAYNSRYWQAGGSPTTVLEADGQIPDPVATQISDRWRERRMQGPDYAPLLSGGVKAREMGADPTKDSAVEVRKEMVADVGRYFGITTSLLNAPAGDSETYGTTESQGIHLINFTLSNYIGAIQDAISDQLPGGRHMVMDDRVLRRGTQAAQAQAFQLAVGKPWMTVEEAREDWGLPPLESPDLLNPAPNPTPVPVAMPMNEGTPNG